METSLGRKAEKAIWRPNTTLIKPKVLLFCYQKSKNLPPYLVGISLAVYSVHESVPPTPCFSLPPTLHLVCQICLSRIHKVLCSFLTDGHLFGLIFFLPSHSLTQDFLLSQQAVSYAGTLRKHRADSSFVCGLFQHPFNTPEESYYLIETV